MKVKGSVKFLTAIPCIMMMVFWLPVTSMAASAPAPPSKLQIGEPTTPPPTTPPPVTPPGNEGLLSGMTPASFKPPSGWSLVLKQDFEGSRPANEVWGSWDGAVSSVRPHGGTKSIEGTYAWGQADVHWELKGESVGPFTELYLSFFEYIDPQALFNDEFFLARFGIDGPFQEVLADWYWARQTLGGPLSFNGPVATLYAVSQGVRTTRLAEKTAVVPKGQWVQWEIHYRPNTSDSSNGFIRIYKDGRLFTSAENANLNGTRSMNNCSIQVGGVYTKAVWMTDYPTCSVPSGCGKFPGDGTDYCTNPNGWAHQSFSKPICDPVDPPLPPFKRHFDDIIVMKK